MEYKVIISEEAESDLDGYVSYLIYEKKNVQAASSLIDDFEETKKSLAIVAESLKLCDNPKLRKQGYRRINFLPHRYFMMYRVEGNVVMVDSIFHELQDYEGRMI